MFGNMGDTMIYALGVAVFGFLLLLAMPKALAGALVALYQAWEELQAGLRKIRDSMPPKPPEPKKH